MNTEQLERAIQCDVYMKIHILGAFPADHIPSHLPLGTGIIVNTDPVRFPGRHWVAFFSKSKKHTRMF